MNCCNDNDIIESIYNIFISLYINSTLIYGSHCSHGLSSIERNINVVENEFMEQQLCYLPNWPAINIQFIHIIRLFSPSFIPPIALLICLSITTNMTLIFSFFPLWFYHYFVYPSNALSTPISRSFIYSAYSIAWVNVLGMLNISIMCKIMIIFKNLILYTSFYG